MSLSGFWFHEDVTPDFTVSMRLDSMGSAQVGVPDIQIITTSEVWEDAGARPQDAVRGA